MIALQIMYWLTQQFLYYLSQHKFGYNPQLPTFKALLQHTQTKILDRFFGCLPVSWIEQVKPTKTPSTGGKSTKAQRPKAPTSNSPTPIGPNPSKNGGKQ